MVSKNRYYNRSKISEAKFRRVIRLFALDLTASDTARLTGVSVRSINTMYLKLRQRLMDACTQASPLSGKVYTEIVPDASKAALMAVIRGKVSVDRVIHSDSWRAYDG